MRKATILGAIAGDIIGSVYEFHSTRNYNFELFNNCMKPTDDTIMTLAVADWLLHDLNLSESELAKTMRSCQETVPQSICAFIDSNDYESAIRETISLGGDADTMGAITGGIASAFYKEIPDSIHEFALSKLDEEMKATLHEFENRYTY